MEGIKRAKEDQDLDSPNRSLFSIINTSFRQLLSHPYYLVMDQNIFYNWVVEKYYFELKPTKFFNELIEFEINQDTSPEAISRRKLLIVLMAIWLNYDTKMNLMNFCKEILDLKLISNL